MPKRVPQVLTHYTTDIARGVKQELGLETVAVLARNHRDIDYETSTIKRYCDSGTGYIDGPPQWFQRFILMLQEILRDQYRVVI